MLLLLFSIRTATGEYNISPNKVINSVESSGIMILAKWLSSFPDDFRLQPVIKVFGRLVVKLSRMLWLLQNEVNVLITQLRKCRGPRLLHAHKLKNLLYDIKVLYILCITLYILHYIYTV